MGFTFYDRIGCLANTLQHKSTIIIYHSLIFLVERYFIKDSVQVREKPSGVRLK